MSNGRSCTSIKIEEDKLFIIFADIVPGINTAKVHKVFQIRPNKGRPRYTANDQDDQAGTKTADTFIKAGQMVMHAACPICNTQGMVLTREKESRNIILQCK